MLQLFINLYWKLLPVETSRRPQECGQKPWDLLYGEHSLYRPYLCALLLKQNIRLVQLAVFIFNVKLLHKSFVWDESVISRSVTCYLYKRYAFFLSETHNLTSVEQHAKKTAVNVLNFKNSEYLPQL